MKPAAQEQQPARSPAEVRAEFRRHGVSIASWAEEKGYEPSLVKDVLLGRVKGHYGKAHEIAVALGIKAKPGKPPEFLKN